MREIGVERSDHPRALVVELEDRAVADHLAVVVAERRVADLPDRESEHVVGEDPIGSKQRIRSSELPLPQGGFVPHAHCLPDRAMFGSRVSEVIRPEPTLPLHELAPELTLNGVERRPCALGAHRSAASPSRPLQPSSSETSRVCSSKGLTAESISAWSKRDAGPWTPMIAASSPRLPQTGAAIACRSSSRSRRP